MIINLKIFFNFYFISDFPFIVMARYIDMCFHISYGATNIFLYTFFFLLHKDNYVIYLGIGLAH